jgi:hypothetical protein
MNPFKTYGAFVLSVVPKDGQSFDEAKNYY